MSNPILVRRLLLADDDFEVRRGIADFLGGPELEVLQAESGLEALEINPADAAARGIADGQTVRLHNARGQVHLKARLTEAVRPGVLYSAKGTWLRTSPTGQTVNALLRADLRTDIESGACYNETFCEVEALA